MPAFLARVILHNTSNYDPLHKEMEERFKKYVPVEYVRECFERRRSRIEQEVHATNSANLDLPDGMYFIQTEEKTETSYIYGLVEEALSAIKPVKAEVQVYAVSDIYANHINLA